MRTSSTRPAKDRTRTASCQTRLNIELPGRAHISLAPNTLKKLERLASRGKYLAIDTEGKHRAFAYSFCNEYGDSVALRHGDVEQPCLACKGKGSWLPTKITKIPQLWMVKECVTCKGRGVAPGHVLVKWVVKRLCENPNTIKVFHNEKHDRRILRRDGIYTKGPSHDTMLISYALDPRRPHGLKELSSLRLGEGVGERDAVVDWIKQTHRAIISSSRAVGYYRIGGRIEIDPAKIIWEEGGLKRKNGWEYVPWSIMGPYAEDDARKTIKLFFYFRKHVKKKPYINVYLKERKLLPVVGRMEDTGMHWNMPMAYRLLKVINMDRNNFQREAFKHAKKEFNILSGKQLAGILFSDLGMEIMEKTAKGNPALDKDHLMLYDHPLATAVLRFRMAKKMDGYMRNFIRSAVKENDAWVIHPNQLQHGTITGRFSIIDPPLQTTPAIDTGRRSHYIIDIRRCFVPRPNHILYFFDYSQIEIKLFAYFTQDPYLIGLIKEGRDFHGEVAAEVTGVREGTEEFSHVRKMTKMVNFGIIFGAGEDRLVQITHEDRRKIHEFNERYHKRLPSVRQFMEKTIYEARRNGYIDTEFGRRIPVDGNRAYAAVNYRIQGTAADILKQAAIDSSAYVETFGGRLLLTMHDETILEVPESAEHTTHISNLRHTLERWDDQFGLPINTDCAVGAVSWSDNDCVKVEGKKDATAINRSVTEALRLRDLRRQNPPSLRDIRIIR